MMPSVNPKPPFTSSNLASGDTSASSAGSSLTTADLSACDCASTPQAPRVANRIAEEIDKFFKRTLDHIPRILPISAMYWLAFRPSATIVSSPFSMAWRMPCNPSLTQWCRRIGELSTFLRVSTSSLNSCTSRDPLWTFARSRSSASMSCATLSRSIFLGPLSFPSFLTIGSTSDARSVAFQRAKALRRIALERGRAEFEAGSGRFLFFALFTASAARARGRFPPRRTSLESRSHLGEPGRSRAVLETFEPAVEVGGGQVKASWQARGLEARRDLLHLADPAPGLARLRGDDLGALGQLGLRAFPFLEQRRFDPFVCRERADRGEQRRRAFGPGRIAGLERGGRAGGAFEWNRFEIAAREHSRDVPRAPARQIDARTHSWNRRGTDDAAIDERRLGGFDHAADGAYRQGRDRVRVDIDAAEAVAGNLAGKLERAVRRTHRQHDVGHAERALERAEIFEPRGFGAGARRRAAPGRRPHDPQAESAEAGADRGAHFAGMEQRDRFHRHGIAARVNVPA